MTTIKLKGGLGNQMFQYATGLAVALHNQDILHLDISSYTNQSAIDTPRSFELSAFNISNRSIVTLNESKIIKIFNRIKNKLIPENPYVFNDKVFCSETLDGFFQNEKYFIDIRDQILKEFTLKDESSKFIETRTYIQSIQSVSMHIRKGDYVLNSHANGYHGSLSLTYYKKAYDELVKHIGKSFTLFIFTDDIEWAQKHITFHDQTYIMSTQSFSAQEELLLMSYCTYNIISNSTFSWWGAWLNKNPNKIVLAPNQWTVKNIENDIILPSWIKI